MLSVPAQEAAMRCNDIMNSNLEWLTEKDTIATAAKKMAETGLGFLPICDGGMRVLGVVTDRDLTVRALAKGLDSAGTSAAMVMSAPALTCLGSSDLREAERLMAEEQKSRIAVVDTQGALVGVISLVDLVEYAAPGQALKTLKAVMWREALGPRGGAPAGQPLLKDDPIARRQPLPADDARAPQTVFMGGDHAGGTKEFP
ncbi:MAG TPA: CBS domain-containing protein [Polyangia bacterium]|nr:CBS domain-containing protein [Polyangia bacterium]